MTINKSYQSLVITSLMFLLACSNESDRIDLYGKWKVVKAEIDGYSITHDYTQPSETWVYFDESGSLLGGRELSDHSGSWKYHPSTSKLQIASSSPRWNNTVWNADIFDSLLYLKGTRISNNYTQKIWLVPAGNEIPPFRRYSDHDKRLTGTWNLLRVKRNSRLVDFVDNEAFINNAQIIFSESGTYRSNLPGDDQATGHGVWDLNIHEQKLSLFPFNTLDNKSWDYSFTRDLLRLYDIEGDGRGSTKWEWIWQKSSQLTQNN